MFAFHSPSALCYIDESTMAPAVMMPPDNHHHSHHTHHHHHHDDDDDDVHKHHHHHNTKPPSPTNSTTSSSSSIRHTYTHLTYSRHHLIDTAMETIKITENGHYVNPHGERVELKEDLDFAVDNCVHYEHEFDFHQALKEFDEDGVSGGNGGSGQQHHHRAGSNEGISLGSLDESTKSIYETDFTSSPTLHSQSKGALNLSFKGNIVSGTNNRELYSKRFPRTSFLVVSASWLESASELLKATTTNKTTSSNNNNNDNSSLQRVGVLNSASATTPGGRFLKGTVSQEDCLCRASCLYSCISQPKFQSEGRFYGKNRSLRYGTSNCVIFSPDVPVIREDSVEGRLLDTYEKVSFVTVPAPNAFTTSSQTGKEYNDIESEQRQKGLDRNSRNLSMVDLASISPGSSADDFDEKFEQKRRALLSSLSDRIHRALSAFVLGGCTDLVLPAFGCGVHGNDPSMVASVFRELLTDPKQFGGRFRTVVFAIPPSRKQNYQAFAAYFQKKEVVNRVTLARGATMG